MSWVLELFPQILDHRHIFSNFIRFSEKVGDHNKHAPLWRHFSLQIKNVWAQITKTSLPSSPTEQGFNQYRKLVLNDFHLKKEQETRNWNKVDLRSVSRCLSKWGGIYVYCLVLVWYSLPCSWLRKDCLHIGIGGGKVEMRQSNKNSFYDTVMVFWQLQNNVFNF